MAGKKANNGTGRKRVDAVRHKDKRKNIPTEELRDYVRDEENVPRKVLYPRDPDLDPQLVWKGKDEYGTGGTGARNLCVADTDRPARVLCAWTSHGWAERRLLTPLILCRKIVTAIHPAIRIMGEIDEVIEAHGGWPDAFVTDPIAIEHLKKRAGGSTHG